jgi:hypothetical protein
MDERIHFIWELPRSGSTLLAVLLRQNLGNAMHHASEFDTRLEAIRQGQASAGYALQPYCLTLEITESTATRDADVSPRILQQLPDMGELIPMCWPG